MTIRAFFRELGRYAAAFSTNWREYDAPLPTKLRLAVRNRLTATFARAQCCGHLGEPGC